MWNSFQVPRRFSLLLTIHRATFFTSADLNPALGSTVLLNFQKQTIGGKIWLEPSDGFHFFQRQNPDLTKQLTIIKTCAGIGAMGVGFSQCGIDTACYNDYNPNFCKWLRAKTNVPVVRGNMTSPSTIHAMHCAAPSAQFIFGVACQPFSALGDQLEQHDQRSESFTGLLTITYFFKSLSDFHGMYQRSTPINMGSRNVEQILPSNWLHVSIGVVAASPDLACLPHPMVGSIVPSKPACTEHSACSKDAFRAEHCPFIAMPDAIDSRRNRTAWTEHPRNCHVQRPTQRNSRECD